jgi:soluble lytic murein transglycosylase
MRLPTPRSPNARTAGAALGVMLAVLLASMQPQAAVAQVPKAVAAKKAADAALPSGDDAVLDAREALRRKDRARLAALRTALVAERHPLALWADYWELGNRLNEVAVAEVDAFYARWPGTYVEDRLRNDWLLELGRRRDWPNFSRDYPRFRMNDDREVTCYALLTQHLAGQNVRDAARAAWYAQRDLDDGCNLLATTLYEAGQFTADDIWQAARLAAESNKPKAVRAAAAILSPAAALAAGEALDKPERVLARRPATPTGTATAAGKQFGSDGSAQIATLALLRLAASDPVAAAAQLEGGWQQILSPDLATLAWAGAGKQAALKLQPLAAEYYQRAGLLAQTPGAGWSDETLAWQVRAGLRAAPMTPERWRLVLRGIEAMSPAEQPAWSYWKARALRALAPAGTDGDAQRQQARALLESISGPLTFYGTLAAEDLGARIALPPAPAPLTAAEREAARAQPGFARALQLIDIGLRPEGVREWNYTLRGLADRELLAAAQLACDRQVWDRCINSSERTRGEIDIGQRYPTPFKREVVAQAAQIGLDPAYMYGLIRQESRFIMDARSGVGASGLMQIMPATAKWTAKKIGLDYKPAMIVDRDTNLLLGASYLKLVLDDVGGSQPMAAAAYNAGPGRPRRWREGPPLEPAAWAENIPFNETRDYVKKVLSNAAVYSAVLGTSAPSLKTRLGPTIGPRDSAAAPANPDLP